jgi:uncharacterized protein DUF4258
MEGGQNRERGKVMVGKYAAVEYDPHVLFQMRDRLISRAQVERVLANSDRVDPSERFPDQLVAEQATQTGATLRVVYVEQSQAQGTVAYVITVIRIGRKRR